MAFRRHRVGRGRARWVRLAAFYGFVVLIGWIAEFAILVADWGWPGSQAICVQVNSQLGTA